MLYVESARHFSSRVGGERGTVTSLDLLASCKWYRWIVLFSPPLSEPCMHLSAHTALQWMTATRLQVHAHLVPFCLSTVIHLFPFPLSQALP
jgi:hypothetical protein